MCDSPVFDKARPASRGEPAWEPDTEPDCELDADLDAEPDGGTPAGGGPTVVTVTADMAGGRLDRLLAEALGLSRAAVVRLLEGGSVIRQGAAGRELPADKNTKAAAGDTLTVRIPEATESLVAPENIPLDIIYEDGDIIVVNKPAGMVVHPAPGSERGTLVNALLYHCGDSLSGIGGVKRPGIVHRIDKDTSGLLVVAKNDEAHRSLAAQLKTHAVSRVYHAITVGNLREDGGTVDRPVGRCPQDRKRMAVFPKGTAAAGVREAVTHYRVLERYPLGARWGQAFCYIACELETGRTHQIRVHMASTGHPLLGDPVYGGEGTRFGRAHAALLSGQCLHAAELRLTHPRTGEAMHFECPLPEGFRELLERLRGENQ